MRKNRSVSVICSASTMRAILGTYGLGAAAPFAKSIAA
jgi:hypothetical protein